MCMGTVMNHETPTTATTPSPDHATAGDARLAPAGPPRPDAKAAEAWTCPMHPEIVRSGAGACPICGMALELRS
jgi:hypothetical protein